MFEFLFKSMGYFSKKCLRFNLVLPFHMHHNGYSACITFMFFYFDFKAV
jgi:hypothetical protein